MTSMNSSGSLYVSTCSRSFAAGGKPIEKTHPSFAPLLCDLTSQLLCLLICIEPACTSLGCARDADLHDAVAVGQSTKIERWCRVVWMEIPFSHEEDCIIEFSSKSECGCCLFPASQPRRRRDRA